MGREEFSPTRATQFWLLGSALRSPGAHEEAWKGHGWGEADQERQQEQEAHLEAATNNLDSSSHEQKDVSARIWTEQKCMKCNSW